MNRLIFPVIAMFGLMLYAGGCSTAPATEGEKQTLQDDSRSALNSMKAEDPELSGFLNRAYGYAILPSVGKGGAIVGGAYGHGVVYESGQLLLGYCNMEQASIGLQLGGQTYSELIAFETRESLNRFTTGKFAFSANASAVALKAGAAATARYENGVAIFTMPRGGLMFEASVGGQQFNFEWAAGQGPTTRP